MQDDDMMEWGWGKIETTTGFLQILILNKLRNHELGYQNAHLISPNKTLCMM
jgi:hypothetical protein